MISAQLIDTLEKFSRIMHQERSLSRIKSSGRKSIRTEKPVIRNYRYFLPEIRVDNSTNYRSDACAILSEGHHIFIKPRKECQSSLNGPLVVRVDCTNDVPTVRNSDLFSYVLRNGRVEEPSNSHYVTITRRLPMLLF